VSSPGGNKKLYKVQVKRCVEKIVGVKQKCCLAPGPNEKGGGIGRYVVVIKWSDVCVFKLRAKGREWERGKTTVP